MFKGTRYLFQGPSFWGPPAVSFRDCTPKWMVKIMVPKPYEQMDDLGGFNILTPFWGSTPIYPKQPVIYPWFWGPPCSNRYL